MLGDIQHTVEIDASPDTVFDVLINPAQLNRWIASNAVVEPHEGGTYDLGWGQSEKILELLPGKKLSLEGEFGDLKTVLTWTLEGSGGKTRLTMVHSGFAPDQETGGLQTGWLNFASWVKSVSEYGADWQPAIKRLESGTESYYPASIGQAQTELVGS
jgi:uncharacterized protein YndB with AHSA1/START domain